MGNHYKQVNNWHLRPTLQKDTLHLAQSITIMQKVTNEVISQSKLADSGEDKPAQKPKDTTAPIFQVYTFKAHTCRWSMTDVEHIFVACNLHQ